MPFERKGKGAEECVGCGFAARNEVGMGPIAAHHPYLIVQQKVDG